MIPKHKKKVKIVMCVKKDSVFKKKKLCRFCGNLCHKKHSKRKRRHNSDIDFHSNKYIKKEYVIFVISYF